MGWPVDGHGAAVGGARRAGRRLGDGPPPISRWRMPVRPDARIVEIHSPQDWAALVTAHPAGARSGEEWWELPSSRQGAGALAELLEVPGQRAARAVVRRHLVPDWTSVADAYDGVHLSWAGFLTAEGYVSDLDGGDVAMLRYWFSERTHWLSDVFGDPEPLDAPDLDTDGTTLGGIDVRTDNTRRQRDQALLSTQLGR